MKVFMYLSLATAFVIALNGFVFMSMWGWFVVPPFGFKSLGWGESTGLMYFISYFVALKRKDREKMSDKEMLKFTKEKTKKGVFLAVLWLLVGKIIFVAIS